MDSKVSQFVKSMKTWKQEAEALRQILLATKLVEELKWSKPCYSFGESNIVIIQPFKACLGLMFFKGSLIKDAKGLLIDNGPNSQAAKRLEFRSVQEVVKVKSAIREYIKQAIDIEKNGQKVTFKKKPESTPKELLEAFTKKPKLKKAFESLTPGRQRAYILHFAGAKQAVTRQSRIEKCTPMILAGKGLNDR